MVLVDTVFETGVSYSLEVGRIFAFLIISPPLMLNDCRKFFFHVTKKGVWRDGSMIMPH